VRSRIKRKVLLECEQNEARGVSLGERFRRDPGEAEKGTSDRDLLWGMDNPLEGMTVKFLQ